MAENFLHQTSPASKVSPKISSDARVSTATTVASGNKPDSDTSSGRRRRSTVSSVASRRSTLSSASPWLDLTKVNAAGAKGLTYEERQVVQQKWHSRFCTFVNKTTGHIAKDAASNAGIVEEAIEVFNGWVHEKAQV